MIIDLHNHSTQTLPAYLALVPTGPVNASLLTPHAMKWAPDLWLFDLRSCCDFWRRRAQSEGITPLSLIQRHLTAQGLDTAAGADHPWQAVLMLGALRERGLKGLVLKASSFGQRLFDQVPWQTWFAAADQLRIHLDALPRHRKHDITCELAQLKRAVSRMNVTQLKGFTSVTGGAMQRRYGPMIAAMWRWTHAGTSIDGFPWVAWQPLQRPTHQRVLDYACWEWDQLSPLIGQDLDRLCLDPAWDRSDHLTQLNWELVFDDLQELTVPIGFRHPHHLHGEQGHHKTTLTRMRERYFATIAHRTQQGDDRTLAVISWRLSVASWFRIPERQNELFISLGRADQNRVHNLENRLHVPLKRYACTADFLPEESFCEGEPSQDDPMKSSRQLCAQLRPIYVYRTARPRQQPRRHGQFLERIQVKWWRQSEGQPMSRDYYSLREGMSRSWLYRDQQGDWYEHGLFS